MTEDRRTEPLALLPVLEPNEPRRAVSHLIAACAGALAAVLLCHSHAAAQQADLSAHDIAKLIQNPLADSISVPFANDTNFNLGPGRQTGNVLNVQPVIPFELNADWNLVTRTTIPFLSPVALSANDTTSFGIGDIVPMVMLSPSHPGDLIWGVGPIFSLPTATPGVPGTGRWAAGPSAVALVMPDPWVFGLLVSQWWSIGGSEFAQTVNRLSAQYFVVYNFPDGSFVSSSPIIHSDFNADSQDRWTVPIGGEVGRVFEISGRAMSASVGLYYNLIRPANGSDWQARLNLTLVFPK